MQAVNTPHNGHCFLLLARTLNPYTVSLDLLSLPPTSSLEISYNLSAPPPTLPSPSTQALSTFPNSDVFHLAVNLMDRYLGYVPAKTEVEYWATAGACTMISLKIRRARRECLNYKHLQAYFCGIPERSIRVSRRERERERGGGGRKELQSRGVRKALPLWFGCLGV